MKRTLLIIFVVMPMLFGCTDNKAPYNRELYYEFVAESGDGVNMKVFLPEENINRGTAVIACPGGGYSYLAGGYEGEDWASFFNERGVAYAVLRYRLPQGNPEIPIDDIYSALHIFQRNASNWLIDKNKIGVMGFSAGGHLASTAATHFDGTMRPDFQILFYPVITMVGATHNGSRDNLLGSHATSEMLRYYSNELHVTNTTPQAFITYATNDTTVPPASNGKAYYDALMKCEVPATLTTFSSGGHGWGGNFVHMAELKQKLGTWLDNL
jgi:acetyl esterase/lipase